MSDEAKTQEQSSEGAGQKQAQSSNTKVVKKEKTTNKKSLKTWLKEISSMFKANVLKISVNRCHTVYKTTQSSATDAQPQYKVLFATLRGSMTDKYAIKADLTKDSSTGEIFMEQVTRKKAKKWTNWEKDVKKLMENLGFEDIQRQITPFDYNKMLKLFTNNKGLWEQCLNWLVDDTGKRDERLNIIALASYLPIPMSLRKTQQHNNCHSLIYTNAGTGKSGGFKNLTGDVGSSSYSETGLVGGGNKGNETDGALNGIGMYPMEETTGGIRKGDDFVPPMEYLLDYMNDGKKARDIASQTVCLGTKTISFIGNITDDQNDFRHVMHNIAYPRENDKHGRRLTLILFDAEVKMMPEDVDLSEQEELFKESLREVLRVFIAENNERIWNKFILKQRKLWSCIDNEYKQKMLDLSTKTTDDVASTTLKGHSIKTPAIKLAAMRVFIMKHLPDIIAGKIKQINSSNIDEYNNYYLKFKTMNVHSFENIVGCDEKMQELLHYLTEKGLKDEDLMRISQEVNEEIQKRLLIGERQVRRILKRYLNMRRGIRRT